MDPGEWRKKLAELVASLQRIWGFKSRVAIGATIASLAAIVVLPSSTVQAASAPPEVAQTSPGKLQKLSAKFLLKKSNGAVGKAFAGHGHGSHSSHSSHSSHRSHRSGAMIL
jgi:hypothetical protein